MSKFRLKVASQDKIFRRIFKGFTKILSHIFSTFLFIATLFFILEKLVPLMKESEEVRQSIRQKQRDLHQEQERLFQVKLAGPFSRQWRPKHYLQFVDLCNSDTSAYKKLTLLNKSSNIIINNLNVKKSNDNLPGFEFSLDIIGTYSDGVKFLTNFENQFSFFRIKSMDLSPKTAEKRYMGLLQFQLEGWLW